MSVARVAATVTLRRKQLPMRRSLRSTTTALLAAALLMAAPAAASASSIYPPVGSCTSDATGAGPGDVIVFGCQEATFGANETVTVTITGENGAGATFGMVRAAVSTASAVYESDADGALPPIEITLPDNARGVYNIAAVSPTSAGGTASAVIDTSDDGALPISGFDSNQLLGLWIGGGALLLAGAVIVGAAAMRRHRDKTED
ncbi:cell wall protein [Microbacterium sp.]|uniref:cell wall protein n=1 Tax=Microbacterium sp. TaxID=51671 RepID=UPI003734EC2D